MNVTLATLPGSAGRANEDAAASGAGFAIVADGATSRTETGCIHGVAWFTRQLVAATLQHSDRSPAAALEAGIRQTAELHRGTCDLSNIATPGAAVAMISADADTVRFLVLGDVTLVTDGPQGISVVVDDRVSRTAPAERAAADALPQGSPEKSAALVAMKYAELAARNVPGGFWAASTDPSAVNHAIVWEAPRSEVRRAAILTDGAARAVDPFKIMDWPEALDTIDIDGPARILEIVRAAEQADPGGHRWIRNKTSDDATIAYVEFQRSDHA